MIDHFGINATDMAAAAAFYDKVLGTLGHRRLMDYGVAVGYGTEGNNVEAVCHTADEGD